MLDKISFQKHFNSKGQGAVVRIPFSLNGG